MTSARLLLRCWRPEDAPLLNDALGVSLAELQMWVPWAMQEPSSLEALRSRLVDMRGRFLAGEDWAYGVFDRGQTRVLGGAGLHPRGRAETLHIGYWIRTDATRQGLATEAAQALCGAAFARPGIACVEIHCDVDNHRSAAIPQRLGFRLATKVRERAVTSHGAERETLVWALARADFEAWRRPA